MSVCPITIKRRNGVRHSLGGRLWNGSDPAAASGRTKTLLWADLNRLYGIEGVDFRLPGSRIRKASVDWHDDVVAGVIRTLAGIIARAQARGGCTRRSAPFTPFP